MAQPRTLQFASALAYFFYIALFSSHYGRIIPSKVNGFTLEVIPDIRKMIKLSQHGGIRDKALAYQMNTTPLFNLSSLEGLNLPLYVVDTQLYLVRVHLGTPGVPLSLALDTGSELTWTQCEPCTQKFHQNLPIFDSRLSSSFRFLPCDRSLRGNYRCIDNKNVYEIKYGGSSNSRDPPTTSGILSQDKLEHRLRINFGCSSKSQNFEGHSRSGVFGGIFGLSMSNLSILQQLRHISNGKFSYCLPSYNAPASTVGHLKFGDDVPTHVRHQFQATEILRDVPGYYYVKLLDVSIGSYRLRLPHSTFSLSDDRRTGGCMFDSGAGYSRIIQPAYQQVTDAFKIHFTQRGFELYPSRNVCIMYKGSSSIIGQLREFPTLTFHFRGGNIVVKPRDLYLNVAQGRAFCVTLVPSPTRTVIGAISQANQRLIYDTTSRQILFAAEDCTNDGVQ